MANINLTSCSDLIPGKFYLVDRSVFHGEGVEDVIGGPFEDFEDAEIWFEDFKEDTDEQRQSIGSAHHYAAVCLLAPE